MQPFRVNHLTQREIGSWIVYSNRQHMKMLDSTLCKIWAARWKSIIILSIDLSALFSFCSLQDDRPGTSSASGIAILRILKGTYGILWRNYGSTKNDAPEIRVHSLMQHFAFSHHWVNINLVCISASSSDHFLSSFHIRHQTASRNVTLFLTFCSCYSWQ